MFGGINIAILYDSGRMHVDIYIAATSVLCILPLLYSVAPYTFRISYILRPFAF